MIWRLPKSLRTTQKGFKSPSTIGARVKSGEKHRIKPSLATLKFKEDKHDDDSKSKR